MFTYIPLQFDTFLLSSFDSLFYFMLSDILICRESVSCNLSHNPHVLDLCKCIHYLSECFQSLTGATLEGCVLHHWTNVLPCSVPFFAI